MGSVDSFSFMDDQIKRKNEKTGCLQEKVPEPVNITLTKAKKKIVKGHWGGKNQNNCTENNKELQFKEMLGAK